MSFFLYTLGVIVALISIACSVSVNSKFNKWSKEENMRGISGCELAERMLHSAGIYDVSVCKLEKVSALDNYYDPKTKTVNLSPDVYDNPSIASVAVAAHECGHAIQHNEAYGPLTFRTALAPIANIGTNIAPTLFIIGFIITILFETSTMMWLIDLGIIAYTFAVLFYLITLPVEFNASNRALKTLQNSDILVGNEIQGAKSVLSAAAMTYVAAAAAAAIQLLRMLVVRNRD